MSVSKVKYNTSIQLTYTNKNIHNDKDGYEDELYRQHLLQVFYMNSFDDKDISSIFIDNGR